MAYDPIKTMFNIKKVAPVALLDEEMTRLLHNFNRKERVYRNNNEKRLNYNFILMTYLKSGKTRFAEMFEGSPRRQNS